MDKNYRPELDPSKTGAAPAVGKDAEMPNAVSTNNGLSYGGEFAVGKITLRATGGGITLRHSKVGDNSEKREPVEAGATNTGLGVNGELKVGAITLAVGQDNSTRMRHENVGTETEVATELLSKVLNDGFFADYKKGEEAETEVAEAAVAGVIEEAFFTRKIEASGKTKTGDATK